jgi:hypothetical protein
MKASSAYQYNRFRSSPRAVRIGRSLHLRIGHSLGWMLAVRQIQIWQAPGVWAKTL